MARVKSFFESRRATMIAGSLLFVVAVSATANPGAVKRQASATATKTSIDFESLTGCHMHGPTQFCMDGSDEYQMILEATMTKDPPTSYTDCHSHGSDTYCMNPNGGEVQVLVEGATATTQTAKETAAAKKDEITAVSDCHMHEASLRFVSNKTSYCIGPSSSEYYVQTTITNTEEYPAQLTSCHSHGEETYCMSDDGEAPILPAADVESGKADPQQEHCHFHAGVEHCVGGGSEEGGQRDCGRKDRDYKIGIRIGMLFVVLVASSIGVFGPILMSTFVPVRSNIVLTILKQFGTGVIISTAFVHLFTHAFMMFGNECLGELQYEATTAAIVMAGLFISFLIEFCVQRAMRWQLTKKTETDSAYLPPKAVEKAEMANITIMEAGIIFHSILIGITLVVAGDSFFITLSIVIIFHQLFEGIALGTRIASLGYGQMPLALGHSHSHSTPPPSVERTGTSTVPLWKKLVLASGFAVVTPIGMAIGIGVLNVFNGNDPATLIAIGTLDALSAGILVWVGLVEMWAQDWMLGGELSDASPLTTLLALFGLVCGMVLMSLLGKWA
ncbi:Zinc-regulated transporter 1 [Fusarium oxysporum f. sp. cubense race 1]|uniref:Zinc-regulated transporter 1 n=1 Tax=Fusarium oxysporum f. sp. cubense (strain race 1) TaxID=1229664 RepID=N4TQT6_FUSC1|nr:Zinc-regulated transporter 1 [Fusarium oxysporum f. sp. cubense race 1]